MFKKKPAIEKYFNFSPNLLCVLDKSLKCLQVNSTFRITLGYTEDEVKNKDFMTFIHPGDQDNLKTILNDLIIRKGEAQIASRAIAKDGTNRWVSWKAYWPLESKEDYIYILGIDKTNEEVAKSELLKTNRQIAEDKAKTDAMLANIGDGVIAVSDAGNILYVNKTAENILGFNEVDVKGKLFMHTVQVFNNKGEPASAEKRPIRMALKTGKTYYSRDFSFLNSNQVKIPVSITASPVFFQGTLIGGVVVFRDITQEKEIDRMKTEFISLASHQLRTPLSAMKWFSEMLLDGDMGTLTNEQREVVGNIYTSNQRMIDLVNSLLNISRIESGRLMVDPEPTDLKKLVDSIVLELQPKIQEKKHHLAVSVHGELPMINVDPKLIRHVYMNLLTNAIKYTPEGGEIVVMISRNQNDVVSQVSDNGYGIPKKQQDRVFQKFFRADNISKVETDGTGLGLYLLKSIVETSNGKIWFSSEEGKGTSFWFSLPVQGSDPKKGEVSIDS